MNDQKKGFAILASVIFFGFLFAALIVISQTAGVNHARLALTNFELNAATEVAKGGLREAKQILMEGYHGELTSGPYSSYNNTSYNDPYGYFSNVWVGKTFPLDGTYIKIPSVDQSGYRVTISQVTSKSTPAGHPGAEITLTAIGQTYAFRSRVEEKIWVYATGARFLGDFAIIATNKMDPKFFEYVTVDGSVAQFSTDIYQLYLSYDIVAATIKNNFALAGDFNHHPYTNPTGHDQAGLVQGVLMPNVPPDSTQLPFRLRTIHDHFDYYSKQCSDSSGSISGGALSYVTLDSSGNWKSPTHPSSVSCSTFGTSPAYTDNYEMDGTNSNLKISGTLFIDGDVIIKGTISGKGKIVATRNIYIAGDVKKSGSGDVFAFLAGGSVLVGDMFAEWYQQNDNAWLIMWSRYINDPGCCPNGPPPQYPNDTIYAWDGRCEGGNGCHGSDSRPSGQPPYVQLPGIAPGSTSIQSTDGIPYIWQDVLCAQSSGGGIKSYDCTTPPTTPGLLPNWNSPSNGAKQWISEADFNTFQGQTKYAFGAKGNFDAQSGSGYYPEEFSDGFTNYQTMTTHIDGGIYADYAVIGYFAQCGGLPQVYHGVIAAHDHGMAVNPYCLKSGGGQDPSPRFTVSYDSDVSKLLNQADPNNSSNGTPGTLAHVYVESRNVRWDFGKALF